MTLQKCIEVVNAQLKNMDQTTTEDVHKVETTRKKQRKQSHVIQSEQAENMPTRNMTKHKPCVFCVEENIVKANPTVPLGAVCVERVAKRITSKTHNFEVEDAPSEEEFLYCVTTRPDMTETVNSVL